MTNHTYIAVVTSSSTIIQTKTAEDTPNYYFFF